MKNKNSILIMNYESLGWYKSTLTDFKKDLSSLFKFSCIYQVYQPTYHSGHYSFAFLSDSIDPMNTMIDWTEFDKKNIVTNYYNKKVHKSSFALPTKVIDNYSKDNKKKLGILITFDIISKDSKKLNNMKNINNFFNKILKIFKLQEIKRISHKFEPYGLTAICLLKESHISIHTWPENNSACIDIFTCGTFINYSNQNKLKLIIEKYFDTTKIKMNQVDREI
jgi:S-adenosylmethionine decarboxylase